MVKMEGGGQATACYKWHSTKLS